MCDNAKFKECIHTIRNMKKLNKPMINDINNMSNKEKWEIIKIFNEIMEILVSSLESKLDE